MQRKFWKGFLWNFTQILLLCLRTCSWVWKWRGVHLIFRYKQDAYWKKKQETTLLNALTRIMIFFSSLLHAFPPSSFPSGLMFAVVFWSGWGKQQRGNPAPRGLPFRTCGVCQSPVGGWGKVWCHWRYWLPRPHRHEIQRERVRVKLLLLEQHRFTWNCVVLSTSK